MAGSLSNTAENSLLLLLFNNTDFALIGDATGLRGSTTAGTFTVHLYTVAPSDSSAGTECDYTDYAPVTVARTSGGWTVSGSGVSNAAIVTFPKAGTTTADTVVGFAVKTGVGGTMIFWGDITTPEGGLIVNTGIAPTFAIGQLSFSAD